MIAPPRRASALAGTGLVLVALAVYLLTSPGRIDISDGQARFEVARNLVQMGRPIFRDQKMFILGLPVPGDAVYSFYGAGASVAAMPLIRLALFFDGESLEVSRFAFSMTGAFFGAALVGVLFAFYRLLGLSLRSAVGWTLVLAFASYSWPLAVTTFDQGQHALFVLLALYLGTRAAQTDSVALSLGAGLAAGALLDYQESYALVVPLLGLSVLAPSEAGESGRRRASRLVLFGMGAAVGLGLFFVYNAARFGDPLFSGRSELRSPPYFQSPVPGALSLLASPGKSILLYSPPVVLGLLGWRGLRDRAPWVALVVLAVSVVHFGFVSCITFFGSDWAWGPRYMGPLVPLWALASPFFLGGCAGARDSLRSGRRRVAQGVVAAGLLVQLLGVSLDHQRYFYERDLDTWFWAKSPWYYFSHSALLSRVGEVWSTVREGVPATVERYNPAPYRDLSTYCIFGPSDPKETTDRWMRRFGVFYLPRPWAIWTLLVPPAERPVRPLPVLAILLCAGAAGAGLLARASTRA